MLVPHSFFASKWLQLPKPYTALGRLPGREIRSEERPFLVHCAIYVYAVVQTYIYIPLFCLPWAVSTHQNKFQSMSGWNIVINYWILMITNIADFSALSQHGLTNPRWLWSILILSNSNKHLSWFNSGYSAAVSLTTLQILVTRLQKRKITPGLLFILFVTFRKKPCVYKTFPLK